MVKINLFFPFQIMTPRYFHGNTILELKCLQFLNKFDDIYIDNYLIIYSVLVNIFFTYDFLK